MEDDGQGARHGARPEGDGHGARHGVSQGRRSFAEALTGRSLDRADIEHILSLFFFDARFKTYIEIRMADSLPLAYALAFAALIKGLFYVEENLRYLEQRLEQHGRLSAAAVAEAKLALREEGYGATVYGREAAAWLDDLITRARSGLDTAEAPYLDPLAQLIATRATLLDEDAAAAVPGGDGHGTQDTRIRD
jgi:glutamate--cysteine ligase